MQPNGCKTNQICKVRHSQRQTSALAFKFMLTKIEFFWTLRSNLLITVNAKTMPNHRTPLELMLKISWYGNFSQPM
jgi:hypothetical protein